MFFNSKYFARVEVKDHPEAKISYEGTHVGRGHTCFRAPGRYANHFTVTVTEEGCRTETIAFTRRTVGITARIEAYIISTGVLILIEPVIYWIPDVSEDGVTRINKDTFGYQINYTGCNTDPITSNGE